MRRFAIVLGLFLIVEGIWGMFSPIVFGVLSTNVLHASIHIVLGVAGIVSARCSWTRSYLLFVGGLLLIVGLLRFVSFTAPLLVSLLNVNTQVGIFNIVVGIICLGFTMTGMQRNRETI